ncbi:imidazoleglycerol-phosphate dehydratase HisB [soil metagenome]
MSRRSERERSTRETKIGVDLEIDGRGSCDVQTGIGFFDHMLDAFARHGLFDLSVRCEGDLGIDGHHTVEDVGIVLGGAFAEALGDKRGIVRFADATVPLDEALVRAVVDISGRPYLYFSVPSLANQPRVGDFDTALSAEFWRAFATEARITMHLEAIRGENAHHLIEATFKATARALDFASRMEPAREGEIPSTKGLL